MSQQILSQDEVDALLQGITGESQAPEEPEVEPGGVRRYDLASQERIVRGRMPTLEVIHERFARNIRVGLFNLIRRSPEVVTGGIKVHKFSAFLREIVVPTNFNLVAVKPLRGSGLIVCEPNLVFAVIERSNAGKPLATWNPDMLPDLPATGAVRIGEPIASGVFLLIMAVLVLWQQFFPFVTDDAGQGLPVLAPGLWTLWIPVLAVITVLELP